MRRTRRLLIVLVVAVGVIGIILLIARHYLSSDRVTAEVAARLEAILGVPVRLERASIGATGTTLSGLELLEVGAGPKDSPWLTVRTVDVDLSLPGLLQGRNTPNDVTLIGASLVLRFDRSNRLLTRLPQTAHSTGGAFPLLRLHDGRLTLRQEGRADLVLTGIDAELRPDGDQLTLTGNVADPDWGDWSASGTLDITTRTAGLTLKTDHAPVTTARLRALPFVPARVWEQVQAEGDAPVAFTLRYDPAAGRLAYRVEATPSAARVHVAALDLTAEQVHGRLVVENYRVELHDLHGRTADGEVEVSGALDFQTMPAHLDLNVALQGLDVRRLPSSWGVPEPLEGRLTSQAALRIVLHKDRTQTTGEGTGLVTEVRLARLPAPSIPLRLQTEADAARLTADIALDNADIEQLVRNLSAQSSPITGQLSFQLRTELPIDTIRDPRTYQGTGRAELPRVSIAGRELRGITSAIRLLDGEVHFPAIRADLEGIAIAGGARLRPANDFGYHATLEVRQGDAAVVHRLLRERRPAFDLEGQFALSTELRGTLKPFTLTARGTSRARALKVDDVRIDTFHCRWASEGQRVSVTDLRAELYGGTLTGGAVLPFGGGEPGSVAFRFEQIDLGDLDSDVRGLPFELQGRASGSLKGAFAVSGPDQPSDFAARIDVQAEHLRVQGLPASNLSASIDYRKPAVDYRCEGDLLGGRFLVQGRLPSRGAPAGPAPEGRLRVDGVRLARLWPEVGGGESLRNLKGVLDVDLGFRHEGPSGQPSGSGRFVLRRLRWGDADLADTLRGDVVVDRQRLRLRDLTATIGQGLLNGQVSLDLGGTPHGWFTVRAQNIEAARLLVPWGEWGRQVQGPVDLHLRGTIGREWTGAGRLSLARGRVLGVEVADLQAPLDFGFAPQFGHGQVSLREAGAQVAAGRVTARASLGWGDSTRLEGQLRFVNVDVQPLLRQAAELSEAGGGRMSGRADFSANDLRSLDDLTASIDASFAQAQTMEFPILRRLMPFLLPGQTASPTFTGGDLQAHLSRGVVRVQRLTLAGTLLQLLLEGTVTLQGRLDLSVTAHPGQSDRAPLNFRLPGGPVPPNLLRQATGFLTNRLVRLHIGGTTRNPTVQVEPLPVLSEDGLRFFLNR